MGIQQMLLGGQGLIEPTVSVGSFAFSDSYIGNSGGGLLFDTTYNLPANWQEKSWSFEHYHLSIPDYNYAYVNAQNLYVNGVLVYNWGTPQSPNYGLFRSWFRDQSAALSGFYNLNLRGGDVVRHEMTIGTRLGSALYFNVYGRLKRLT